jgi:HK97 family phage prohead protease
MGPQRFPDGTERRAVTELRAAGRRLQGHAAIFNSEARIGTFTETILPGAFRSSLLSGKDVLALVDHDTGRLLGRTRAGTLTLSEDARGLAFSIEVPNTTLGADILALAERGDLGGMSFSFRATDEAWPTRDRRELRAVDLLEVSVVQAFPAYDETTVSARARLHASEDMAKALRFRRMLAGVL